MSTTYASHITQGGREKHWCYSVDPTRLECETEYNEGLPWEDRNMPIDFLSVVLHEMGHGLGFTSRICQDGKYLDGTPEVFDCFLTNIPYTLWPDLQFRLIEWEEKERCALMFDPNTVFWTGLRTTMLYSTGWP